MPSLHATSQETWSRRFIPVHRASGWDDDFDVSPIENTSYSCLADRNPQPARRESASQLTRSSARFSDSFENWMSLPGVPWFEMERTFFHVKTLSRVTPLMENMCNFGQPHSCFSEDFETLVCWHELHAYVLGDSMMTFVSISLVFDTVKYMMTYHWRHRKCNSHTWHSW